MNKTVELTPRLRQVAELVPQGARLADIGTDHAYLPAWLLLAGKIPSAIAADLREGPLERARETARQYGCTDRMDFRLCDGLAGVRPGEVDAVVIAGMGGETIAGILEVAPWVREEGLLLVLQPMSTQPELRRWLAEHGMAIREERLAAEGDTLYVVMTAQRGEMTLTPGECWVGQQSRDPLRGEYLTRQLDRLDRALAGMALARGDQVQQRRRELEQIRRQVAEMKEEWQRWQ